MANAGGGSSATGGAGNSNWATHGVLADDQPWADWKPPPFFDIPVLHEPLRSMVAELLEDMQLERGKMGLKSIRTASFVAAETALLVASHLAPESHIARAAAPAYSPPLPHTPQETQIKSESDEETILPAHVTDAAPTATTPRRSQRIAEMRARLGRE